MKKAQTTELVFVFYKALCNTEDKAWGMDWATAQDQIQKKAQLCQKDTERRKIELNQIQRTQWTSFMITETKHFPQHGKLCFICLPNCTSVSKDS